MNLQMVGRREKSPMVKCTSPISQIGGVDAGVRQLEEFLQQPQLMHDLQGGGMHRVAAEIAQEVLVLLQHRDIHPGAGQQKAAHHARRAAAGDHAVVEMTSKLGPLFPPAVGLTSNGRCAPIVSANYGPPASRP